MSFKYSLRGNSLGFNNILETILKNRGIQDISSFLNLNEKLLESESLYDNIEEAYKCVLKHLEKNSKIVIEVDCDADGYTSASLIYQYLLKLKTDIDMKYIIHDDKKHGLDGITMEKIQNMECDLLIIPDASSNDYEQHKILKTRGIDIIVLDHHLCDRYSEDAIVVNNQLSKDIKNKAMTGVGVCYKFCKYIDKKLEVNYADDFLDLVTVGMIADVCDLRDVESRYLVSKGIEQITKELNQNKLITSFIKEKSYDMKNEVTIMGIAWYIAPMINSIIRNGTYEEKEILFKSFINSKERYVDKVRGKGEVEMSSQEYTVRIANRCKRKQKKIVEQGVLTVEEQINQYKLNKNGIIIINATGIVDKNYTGLIANKISSIYQKPCLLLSNHEDSFAGSGRGYEKKEIKNFKQWCENTKLFTYAEGHDNAMGVSIKKDNINKLYEIASMIKTSDVLIYDVDGIFNEKTINKLLIESITKYKNIWGTTVDEPIFAIENITINKKDIQLMGKKKNTIKMTYNNVAFMWFNANEDIFNDMIQHEAVSVTVVGKFNVNEYQGNSTPQIFIEDLMFKPSVVKFRF